MSAPFNTSSDTESIGRSTGLEGPTIRRPAGRGLLECAAMDERVFHLRSVAVHEGESNDPVQLDLEIETSRGWEPVSLSTSTAPFRAFVCTDLMCQHAYLRMNASERGLVVTEARGELWMKTEDWYVRELTARFTVTVEAGEPSSDDQDFISERMRNCPISRNLASAEKQTIIELVPPRS